MGEVPNFVEGDHASLVPLDLPLDHPLDHPFLRPLDPPFLGVVASIQVDHDASASHQVDQTHEASEVFRVPTQGEGEGGGMEGGEIQEVQEEVEAYPLEEVPAEDPYPAYPLQEAEE